jgi:FSR family fosmidomycin resistance protein-like MFS transporter
MSPSDKVVITHQRRLQLLVVTVAGHAIKHFFNAGFFVLLPEMKISLSISNLQVGTLSTVRNISAGLANVPAGFIADRLSDKRAEILGPTIGFMGVFAVVLGLSPTFGLALISSSLFAIAITFWHPAAIGWLAQQFSDRRGFAIGLHGTGGSIGEALGPLIVGFLLTTFTWREVLQGSGLPTITLGFLIWFALRTIPVGEALLGTAKAYWWSLRQLLKNRRLMLILLFSGGFGGGQAAILTFLPIYLREDIGVSTVTLGVYLFMANAPGIGSQPLLGYFSDRIGRKLILVPGLAILGITYWGLYIVPFGWPFTAVILLMGLFIFPLMAVLLASAADLVEESVQGTTVSLVFGSAVVVSGLSPVFAGFLADAYGIPSTFLWASGITLATALIAGVTNWQKSK